MLLDHIAVGKQLVEEVKDLAVCFHISICNRFVTTPGSLPEQKRRERANDRAHGCDSKRCWVRERGRKKRQVNGECDAKSASVYSICFLTMI